MKLHLSEPALLIIIMWTYVTISVPVILSYEDIQEFRKTKDKKELGTKLKRRIAQGALLLVTPLTAFLLINYECSQRDKTNTTPQPVENNHSKLTNPPKETTNTP